MSLRKLPVSIGASSRACCFQSRAILFIAVCADCPTAFGVASNFFTSSDTSISTSIAISTASSLYMNPRQNCLARYITHRDDTYRLSFDSSSEFVLVRHRIVITYVSQFVEVYSCGRNDFIAELIRNDFVLFRYPRIIYDFFTRRRTAPSVILARFLNSYRLFQRNNWHSLRLLSIIVIVSYIERDDVVFRACRKLRLV